MKAIAVTPAKHAIGMIDHPEPRLVTPTGAKLRMLDVGVCGTDKEICAFDYGTPPNGSDHLVIGHESLGEVVEVGSQVTDLKRGDLVVTMVRRPCADPGCIACRAGRADFCSTGGFTERGIKMAHGFMTEAVVDETAYMIPVPRALREVGVLVEPLTIAMKAIEEVWQVQARLPWGCPVKPGKASGYCHRALVLGGGPVGLLGAMALIVNGFETVVYSREPVGSDKCKLVEAIGGIYVSAETDRFADILRRFGTIDVVYEAAGASALAFEVIQGLGTNGIFVFTGVPGRKAPIAVDTDLLMRNLVLKNQVVFGSVNAGRECYEAAVTALQEFMRRWPAQVRALITGRFPIEQAEKLLLGGGGGIKNVIAVGG
jgi:threonine dehydrogenase-like Zn-dependent dehydrogenase